MNSCTLNDDEYCFCSISFVNEIHAAVGSALISIEKLYSWSHPRFWSNEVKLCACFLLQRNSLNRGKYGAKTGPTASSSRSKLHNTFTGWPL
ncbi:hypothetical protein T4A_9529 [Trichinella pseudospiralis]|uniref:Uncharacterized protein n=1 Tax=Trichinella pseudospiralis TaxID=6337 RepID=A0A0V1ECJ1_TRIPS|nr:hypothetical protein T4A_9529 [Trichinella pseudospiralis]